MRKIFVASLVLALAGFAGSANAQTVVSTDVTTDTVWGQAPNLCPIILERPIFVKVDPNNPVDPDPELTILSGCIVRGQPRTGPVTPGVIAGSPGALIVTQSGRINAAGNEAAPVIMTTAAVDNDNDGVADDDNMDGFDDAWVAGDIFLDDDPLNAPLAPLDKAGEANVSKWGGLVVLGEAPTNLGDNCGVGYGKCTVEGLTIPGFSPIDATYGGVQPHDSSGSLRYVSVRHAGDEIGAANELNGISLGGVGDGTVFEFIEVYNNFDDGIEWFGGTVDGNHLAVFFAGDDTFDVDQGYTGVNQFLFGVMPFFNTNIDDDPNTPGVQGAPFGSASGDKGCECDGDDFGERGGDANIRLEVTGVPPSVDPTCWPLSGSDFYNVTIVGSTPDSPQHFSPVSAASANRGWQVRNGYAGRLLNSIIVNTGSRPGLNVVGGLPDPNDPLDLGDACPGFNAGNNADAGLLLMVSTTIDDTAQLPLGTFESTVIANGDAYAAQNGATANTIESPLFPGLNQEDGTFDPTGNAAGKLDASLKPDTDATPLTIDDPLDPRPGFGFIGVAGGVAPTGPGLDPAATYRGAFDRSSPRLWTTGWTALNNGGVLED